MIAKSGKGTSAYRHENRDHSLLVQIFLWEKDIDNAWREAKAGGCYDEQWLTLADKRAATHPADSLPIYKKEAETQIARMGNESYRAAAQRLRKIHELMERMNESAGFNRYVAELRLKHKPKRNFIKLLDQATW